MRNILIIIFCILTATTIFSQTTHTYQYDNENRVSNSADGVKTQQYQYDNLGNRVLYNLSSSPTLFPDLSVTDISIPATDLEQGQTITASCTINNTGAVDVQNSILRVFLSETPQGVDNLVSSYSVASITAGNTENITFDITLPNTIATGNQYLVFFIDAVLSIVETDETNNKNNIAVNVLEPSLAELNFQNASVTPMSIAAGNEANFVSDVFNTGSINANNAIVHGYLSLNSTFDVNDVLLAEADQTLSLVTAGGSSPYNQNVSIPSNTVAGNYFILLVVDQEATVPELDEENNVVAISITVTTPTNTYTPVANFSVDNQLVPAETTVQFTDQSTNNPTSWIWYFPGGTPSSSTLQNPAVTYNTVGEYDVTLIASNSNGQNQKNENNYIEVTLDSSQLTYVPDDNFEQALIDYGYDSGDLDDYVPTANITSVIALDIASKNVVDLTGIEDFLSLTTFYCQDNAITNINLVENNILLTDFNCSNNNLTSLALEGNTYLSQLNCSNNQLTSLLLSNNNYLTSVLCNDNLLEFINVNNGNNVVLTTFNAINNANDLCIQVDNANDANNGVNSYSDWQKDESAGYSSFCGVLSLFVNTEGNGTVTISPDMDTYELNDEVTLTATPDSNWLFAGWTGDYVGTESSITITMDADKTLTATFDYIDGVTEETMDNRVMIFPNPTNDVINIVSEQNTIINNEVLYDAIGKSIVEFNTNPQQISLKSFADGIYYLEIRTNQGVVTMKVVKE